MKKDEDLLLNELTQSNRLLAEANRKLLKRLNDGNEQIAALKEEIARIQANSIDSKHLNIIKEKIARKSQTLIKLNNEVESLRKENLSKEEQNRIIRELNKQLDILTKEREKSSKDNERLKVIMKEKDEAIKDFIRETKGLRQNERFFDKALHEMQENLQNKDALIIKLNNEIEEGKKRLVEAKQAHKTTAEKLAASKDHINTLAEDNRRLAQAEDNFRKIHIHLGKHREERIKLKEHIKKQQGLIEKLSKKRDIASKQSVSDNLSFLMQLKMQLDKAELDQKKTFSEQKDAINKLMQKFKRSE